MQLACALMVVLPMVHAASWCSHDGVADGACCKLALMFVVGGACCKLAGVLDGVAG